MSSWLEIFSFFFLFSFPFQILPTSSTSIRVSAIAKLNYFFCCFSLNYFFCCFSTKDFPLIFAYNLYLTVLTSGSYLNTILVALVAMSGLILAVIFVKFLQSQNSDKNSEKDNPTEGIFSQGT